MMDENESMCDLASLYQQFLNSMKDEQKKESNCMMEREYKQLYSQIRESNEQKRNQRASAEKRQLNMRNNGCKFANVEGYHQLSTLKNNFVLSQSRMVAETDQESLDGRLIMEKFQKKELQKEMDNCRVLVCKLKQQISKIKTEIKKVDLQQAKFQEAQHLANTIVQHVDQRSIANGKSYSRMLAEQDLVLTQLKSIKDERKNELSSTQQQYEQQRQCFRAKQKLKSSCPLPFVYDPTTPVQLKGLKTFLLAIARVYDIFFQRNGSIKAFNQSPKTLIKRFNDELPIDQINWIKFIEEFEEKFEVKVESTSKELIELHHKLKKMNQSIEKEILQKKCLIEEYQSEYKSIQKKDSNCDCTTFQVHEKDNQERVWKNKINQVRANSMLFIQIMQSIHTLLIKFRYIFKLYHVDNVETLPQLEHLKQQLNQITNEKNQITSNKLFNFKKGPTLTQYEVNRTEIFQIFSSKYKNFEHQTLKQIIDLLFCDARVAFNWMRATYLAETYTASASHWEQLIKIFETIREECERSYRQKLKNFFHVLLECFNGISKRVGVTTLAMGAKMYIHSHQQKNKLLNSELSLCFKSQQTSGEVEKVEYQSQQCQQVAIEEIKRKEDEKLKEVERAKSEIKVWGEQDKKNPSSMIRRLVALKSQSSRKIKVLDFHQPTKRLIKLSLGWELPTSRNTSKINTPRSSCKTQRVMTQLPIQFKREIADQYLALSRSKSKRN